MVIDIFTYYFQYWQTDFCYLYFQFCASLTENKSLFFFLRPWSLKSWICFKIWWKSDHFVLFVFYLLFFALRTSLSWRYDGFVSKKPDILAVVQFAEVGNFVFANEYVWINSGEIVFLLSFVLTCSFYKSPCTLKLLLEN